MGHGGQFTLHRLLETPCRRGGGKFQPIPRQIFFGCRNVWVSSCLGVELSGVELSGVGLSWCRVVLVSGCPVSSCPVSGCPGVGLSGCRVVRGVELSGCRVVRCRVVLEPFRDRFAYSTILNPGDLLRPKGTGTNNRMARG